MIDIGIQTKSIWPDMGIERGAKLISDAGFTRVDFNIDTFLKNTDLYSGRVNDFFKQDLEKLVDYFLQYRAVMDANGIRPSQMHAPYPWRVEGRGPQNDFMMTEAIPKSIVIAEMLGVPWVVLHPAKLQYMYGIEAEHNTNIEYFKAIVPLLKQCNVKICVENLYEGVGGRITEGVCADPYDAIYYIDTMNDYAGEELFGLCLDTGHLQLVRRDHGEYIRVVGNRLKILHMHENDANGDLHQLPFSFGDRADSGLNWDGFIAALRDIGFDGTLSFETYPCVNTMPDSAKLQAMKTIHAIGEYFKSELEK